MYGRSSGEGMKNRTATASDRVRFSIVGSLSAPAPLHLDRASMAQV
jgi:hypothetical protein